MERDDELRAACFLALDALRAQLGEDLPYRGVLDQGFQFQGKQIPFFTPMRGIYRSRYQAGPAALSITTSPESRRESGRYRDTETDLGYLYEYQAGPEQNWDNTVLRRAYELQVPVAYFRGLKPGWYQALYPWRIAENLVGERRVLVSPPAETQLERSYAVRQATVRLHQGRFRRVVLPAYHDQCAICRLKELSLLDAAHIVGDLDPGGIPVVSNGVSLCSIHHRAFDKHLVGISPDYEVHVSRRLLEDEDGPMLDLLKGFHLQRIQLPTRRAHHPDRERLAARFEQFD